MAGQTRDRRGRLRARPSCSVVAQGPYGPLLTRGAGLRRPFGEAILDVFTLCELIKEACEPVHAIACAYAARPVYGVVLVRLQDTGVVPLAHLDGPHHCRLTGAAHGGDGRAHRPSRPRGEVRA